MSIEAALHKLFPSTLKGIEQRAIKDGIAAGKMAADARRDPPQVDDIFARPELPSWLQLHVADVPIQTGGCSIEIPISPAQVGFVVGLHVAARGVRGRMHARTSGGPHLMPAEAGVSIPSNGQAIFWDLRCMPQLQDPCAVHFDLDLSEVSAEAQPALQVGYIFLCVDDAVYGSPGTGFGPLQEGADEEGTDAFTAALFPNPQILALVNAVADMDEPPAAFEPFRALITIQRRHERHIEAMHRVMAEMDADS